MSHLVVEISILSAFFYEPDRYFRFDKSRCTNDAITPWRKSAHFTRIERPTWIGEQALLLSTKCKEGSTQRIELNNRTRHWAKPRRSMDLSDVATAIRKYPRTRMIKTREESVAGYK